MAQRANAEPSEGTRPPWWQTGVVYQIYPRSFMDANGDGVGDLRGIVSRLSYLEWIGVDAIWISPFYPSPIADFGYDVSDYTGVDPLFGTLEGFDALIAEAHSRRIKVILDYVPNHTSDEHPWFVESRSSRENPRRDWYLWRDPPPMGVLRTTGRASSAAAAPGSGTRVRGSTTFTPSM
jgi:alpha-glucosidase